MDNINVIRVGFFVPELLLADTEGEIGDPVDRSGEKFTCLALVNPDEDGANLIKMLESGLPRTSTGFELALSIVVPAKMKIGKAFKEKHGIQTRIFCDSDSKMGSAFSIVDSSKERPSYHPVIFIVGDESSVRFRQIYEPEVFNYDEFRRSVSKLI